MSKFKIGDKVRRERGEWTDSPVGHTGIVTKTEGWLEDTIYIDNGTIGYSADNFELYQYAPEDFDTGCIFLHRNGKFTMVLQGANVYTEDTGAVAGYNWHNLGDNFDGMSSSWKGEHDIMKVYKPESNRAISLILLSGLESPEVVRNILEDNFKVVWEREQELTPEQKEKNEIKEQMDKLSKRLEELKV